MQRVWWSWKSSCLTYIHTVKAHALCRLHVLRAQCRNRCPGGVLCGCGHVCKIEAPTYRELLQDTGTPTAAKPGKNWTEEDRGCIVGPASSGQRLLPKLEMAAVSDEKEIRLHWLPRPLRWTGAGGRPKHPSPAAPGEGASNCRGFLLPRPSPRCPSPRSPRFNFH